MDAEKARSPGGVTWTGLALVGTAAAILTFTTLRDLAMACGITETFLGIPLAWLLPITVDATGAVAVRIWLTRRASAEAVLLAQRLSWTCVGLSILGNAGQHGMAAYEIAAPWWVIVLVSAVPPAMLGAVVHLTVLLTRDAPESTGAPASVPAETAAVPAETAAPTPMLPETAAAPAPVLTETAAPDAPPAPIPAKTLLLPSPEQGAPDAADALLPELSAWITETGEVPSKRKVMERFNVGNARAGRLLAALPPPTNGHARPDLVAVK